MEFLKRSGLFVLLCIIVWGALVFVITTNVQSFAACMDETQNLWECLR